MELRDSGVLSTEAALDSIVGRLWKQAPQGFTARGLVRTSVGILDRQFVIHTFSPWNQVDKRLGWNVLLPPCGSVVLSGKASLNRSVWDPVLENLRLKFLLGFARPACVCDRSDTPAIRPGLNCDLTFVFVKLLSASWSRSDCLPHCPHSLPSTHLLSLLTGVRSCHQTVLSETTYD